MSKYIFVPQKKQITTNEYIEFVVDGMEKSRPDLKMEIESHIELGLITEAGELLSELHKWEAFGKPLDYENILEELGDLLFYIVAWQNYKFDNISIFEGVNCSKCTPLSITRALSNAIKCSFESYHAAVFIAAARQQFEFTIDQIMQYNYEKLLKRPLAGEYYKNNKQQQQGKKSTETQIDGNHYTKLAIQPFQYSMKNNLNPLQHTIIKYVTRYQDKNGIVDLEKAKHCIDMLIDYEEGNL